MKPNNIFQKFLFLIVLFSLSLLGACASGDKSGTDQGTGGGLTVSGGLHFCEQEPNRGSPDCRLVLAGFSGTFKWLNLPTLQGYFRNNFYPDGKLKTFGLYQDEKSNKPLVEHNYTYDGEGRLLTFETLTDSNFDGSFDLKFSAGHSYNPTFNTVTGQTTPPDNPSNIQGTFFKAVMPGSPTFNWASNQIFTVIQLGDANNVFQSASNELSDKDANGNIVSSKIIHVGQSNVETVAEKKSFAYTDGKPTGLVHTFFYCPDQAGATCVKPLTPTSPPAPLKDVLNAYLKIETTWEYPEGKLRKIEAKLDGDTDAHGPNAGIDGNIDATVTCEIDYFPFTGNVIAKFPEEMKAVGLSETDKLKSLHCHDNGLGLVDVKMEFTDWRYLRDVTGENS